MRAGNGRYEKPADLPGRIPVFPLSGALLLPAGQMPLNIFEPRYLALVDHAMATDRIIGMVQPRLNQSDRSHPKLRRIATIARARHPRSIDDRG